MDATYAEIGTEVVIGFGNWCVDYQHVDEMEALRGTQTTITQTHRFDDRELWCHVTVDKGKWWWPVCDMILASDIDLLMRAQRARIK